MADDPRIAALKERIRAVPDFPKPGILFRDVTPLLADADTFRLATRLLAERIRPLAPSALVGIESRGFLFGAPLAHELGVGFVPVRKPGKLPYKTRRVEYALEYGTDGLEMHVDAVKAGDRVVVVDDLLATGGTAAAGAKLCTDHGAEVAGFAFLIELAGLGGRQKLAHPRVEALIEY
jgi:adenine phosphoribosyltransferase